MHKQIEGYFSNVDFSSPIDWDNVNAILEKQRISSKNLLLNSLN